MKKFISLILSFIMSLTLIGCGSESHEEEIKNTIDTYFASIKSGDYNKSMEITTKNNGGYTDNFGLSELEDSLVNEFNDINNMGEVFNEEAKKFTSYVMSKAIGDFSIDEVKEKNDQATVLVSGKCLNFEKFAPSKLELDVEGLSKKYLNEHLDELNKIYAERGQDAMNQKIFDDITPEIFDRMKKVVDNAEQMEFKMEIIVKNLDGQWLISDIQQVQ